MKTRFLFMLGLALTLMVVGCKKSEVMAPGPNWSSDEEYLRYAVTASDSVGELNSSDQASLDDQDYQPMDYGTFGKVPAEIEARIKPLRWGRRIENISRSISVQVAGDTAIATIVRTINGRLIIAAAYSDTATVPDTIIRKPFTSNVTKKVKYLRVGRGTDHSRNWRPIGITLVDGGTNTNDFGITKLEFFLPNGDSIVVTNPLQFWLHFRFRGPNIPELAGNSTVRMRLTLTSATADTELVVLRYGWRSNFKRRVRVPIISEVNNSGTFTRVYERSWQVHTHRGWFHAMVDAMSKGSLFDDAAPYSNKFWGIPYIVR